MNLLHYEPKHAPLLPRRRFYSRLARNIAAGSVVLLLFLGIGIAGYRYTCGFSWLDSLLNASMILSGMGPATPITSDAGKWFASIYALFSGVVFVSTIGLILAPVAHRVFHLFHLEDKGGG